MQQPRALTAVSPACTRSRTPTALVRGHKRLLQPRPRDAARQPHRGAARPDQPASPTSRRRWSSRSCRSTWSYVGGFSPLAFGVIDGIYNGATAIVRLAERLLGDRWRRHKEVAVDGLRPLGGLQAAAARPSARRVSAIGAIVLLDRAGKGIRTAPRDAMISLSTPRASSAPRSACTARWTRPARCSARCSPSRCSRSPRWRSTRSSSSLLHRGRRLRDPRALRAAASAARRRRAEHAPRRRCAGAGPRSADAALPGAAARRRRAQPRDGQRRVHLPRAPGQLDLGNSLFPLLFVGSAGTFMVLAVPMGRLADRFGRGTRAARRLRAAARRLRRCCCCRSAAGCCSSAALGLLGAYYAATDGVLMALGSAVVPDEIRGSGLALLGTATSVARLVASLAFGALWTVWGIDAAFVVLRRRPRRRRWRLPRRAPARADAEPVRERRRRALFARAGGRLRAGGRWRRGRGCGARRAIPARGAVRRRADALRRGRARRARPMVVFRNRPTSGVQAGSRRSGDALRPRRRTLAPLRCDRVYFGAGAGSAWRRGSGFAAGYRVKVFDARLRVRHEVEVDRDAEPRPRLARRALRLGDAVRRPATRTRPPGTFSTQTTLIDLARGHEDRRPRGVHRHARRPPGDRRRHELLGRDVRHATATASTRRWRPAARPT